jgi:hypothetical protein
VYELERKRRKTMNEFWVGVMFATVIWGLVGLFGRHDACDAARESLSETPAKWWREALIYAKARKEVEGLRK